jgi:predicted nucleotidyltransferase
VGATVDRPIVASPITSDPLLQRFSRRLWNQYRAHVYLFGSRARGTQQAQSDYDLVAVAAAFVDVSPFRRCLDRDDHWLAAGGWRLALDLHCFTPEEFRREKAGLGYLGEAFRKGELLRIALGPRREAVAAIDFGGPGASKREETFRDQALNGRRTDGDARDV